MFTTKTEYGLRALVALANNSDNQPLSLAQIAKSEQISLSYLEQIFKKLKSRKIVRSIKGAEGGYLLFRPAKNVTLLKILETLEGPLAVAYCLGDNNRISCSCRGCLTKKVWAELQRNVIKTLKKFNLTNLIK